MWVALICAGISSHPYKKPVTPFSSLLQQFYGKVYLYIRTFNTANRFAFKLNLTPLEIQDDVTEKSFLRDTNHRNHGSLELQVGTSFLALFHIYIYVSVYVGITRAC